MGYSYGINRFTGRQTLACDICGKCKGDTPTTKWVKKRDCPFKYCGAPALCNECWKKETIAGWKKTHLKYGCKQRHDEYVRTHQ